MADPAMDPVTPGDAWQRELTTRLETLRALPEPPSFRPAATDQFLARLAAEAPRPASSAPPLRTRRIVRWPALGMRLAGVALAVLLALLGTSYVAAASLPGAPLYPLKRQAEELRVTFAAPDTRDDVRRALLETRRGELSALVAQQAPAPQVAAGVSEYTSAVAAAQISGDSPALRAQLRAHRRWLSALEVGAAPAVLPLLEAARQAVEASLPPAQPGPAMPGPATPTATATPRATPVTPTPRAQPASTATSHPREGDNTHPASPTVAPIPATRMPAAPTAAPRRPPAVPPRPHPPTARPLPAPAAPAPPGPGPGPTPGSPPESPGPEAGPGAGPGSAPEPSGPGPGSAPEPSGPGPGPGNQPEPSGPGPGPGNQPEPPGPGPGPGSPPEAQPEPTRQPEPPGPGPGGQPEPPGPESGSPPAPHPEPTSAPEPPGSGPGPDDQSDPGGAGAPGRP